jgi:acyl-CoA reductase-like NAD-dependent aldehyde dehydrogenase
VSASPETFESLDPATGEVVGTWPTDDADAVRAAVARAAASSWSTAGYPARRRALNAWRHEIARRCDELAALVHSENGKPVPDAMLEILVALDHLAWSGAHAARVLRGRRVRPGILALNHAAAVRHEPLGVVGVIGPWNYPVLTPMGSLCYALAAGNPVVYKPSEYTPGIGAWLVEAWRSAVPADLVEALQLVTGGAATGAALCRAGIAKLAFTGSESTGRRVMAQCAENLVPVLLECGGKDAAIVTEGADLDAAADAVLWGGLSNGGQTCLGIERVYVVGRAYEPFVAALTARAAKLTAGQDYGPITMPAQVAVIRRHVEQALARGARALTGGRVDTALVPPTVLVDVPLDAAAVQEETFGPTLTVTRVADDDEALRQANATPYGLGGAVFDRSGRRGARLAEGFRSGMVSVNSVMTFASVPGLPMGGVGASGFGRTHGPEGLLEFTRTKAVTRERVRLPLALSSFERTTNTDRLLRLLLKARHARG